MSLSYTKLIYEASEVIYAKDSVFCNIQSIYVPNYILVIHLYVINQEKIYEQMSKKFKGESSSNIFEPANSTRDSLAGTRKGVKLLLAEAKALTNNLRNIIHKVI